MGSIRYSWDVVMIAFSHYRSRSAILFGFVLSLFLYGVSVPFLA
ncbi:hypothetical protein [Ectobacillus sp. JY-23]|nr:hypothetical protein [Ectobacillus sp. JY-23]